MSKYSISPSVEDLRNLFDEAKSGNQDSYYHLFRAHVNQVLQALHFTTYQFTHFEQDDLLQELYLTSWRDFGNIKHYYAFHQWLRTVASNIYRKMLRKAAPWKRRGIALTEADLQNIPAEECTILEKLSRKENRNYLDIAIHNLSPEDQDFINFFYFSGLSQQSICEMLNYSNTSSLRKRRKKVIGRLQYEYERQTGEKTSPESLNYFFIYLGTGAFGPWEIIQEGGMLSSCFTGLKILCSKACLLTTAPLIWITVVMICSNKVMATMVNQTSHVANRLWLLRRIFVGYCGVVLLPVIVLIGVHVALYLFPAEWSRNVKAQAAAGSIVLLLFIMVTVFIVLSRYQYKRISNRNDQEFSDSHISTMKESVKSLIYIGSFSIGICILGVIPYYSLSLYLLSAKYPLSKLIENGLFDTFRDLTLYMGYHLMSFMTFRKLLFDVESSVPSPALSNGETPVHRSITSLFIIVTILIPVLTILFVPKRMGLALCELPCVVIWWLLICRANQKKYNFWYFMITFILQLTILRIIPMFIVF